MATSGGGGDLKNKVSMRLARPWSTTQSMFAKTLGERAMAQSILHLDAHRRLWWINICFVLPTIVLSLLGGACNSSQSSLVALWPVKEQEHVGKVLPLILGLVGLMVSVLNSVQSYLGTARLVESHYIAHTGFSKLQRLIASEVSLPHQERSVSGTEAISGWRAQYDQLLENSPSVSVKLEKRFSNRRDVKKAGIVVPPNIKVKGITTFEEIEQAMMMKSTGQQQQQQGKQKRGLRVFKGKKKLTGELELVRPPPLAQQAQRSSVVDSSNQLALPPRPRLSRGKSGRKQTQLELDDLQNTTRGRVASIAKGGLRPPSPESTTSSEDEVNPAELVGAAAAMSASMSSSSTQLPTTASSASSSSSPIPSDEDDVDEEEDGVQRSP